MKEYAEALYPKKRAGDFAQAMMDLGSGICTPKNPDCAHCPCRTYCGAYKKGVAGDLPRRLAKPPKPKRRGRVFWLENKKGQVLMMRRPDKGLLGGMVCFPSIGWDKENETDLADIVKWQRVKGEVSHIFTHFHLTLKLHKAQAPKGFRAPPHHFWVSPQGFDDYALPSLMKKVAKFAD